MIKTIIVSLLIIIVLNYILHYIKDVFTEPIIRYVDKPIVRIDNSNNNSNDNPMEEKVDDMKNELIMFLDKR